MKKGMGAILSVLSGAAGATIGAGITVKKFNKKVDWYEKRVDKFKSYFDVTNEWIRLKNQGKNLAEYFQKNGWSHIAIYGMGELGNRLLEELKNSDIVVEYAIDKHAEKEYAEINILEVEEELPIVDVIVITPIYVYDEVEELLAEKMNCPIVSIEDVVYTV